MKTNYGKQNRIKVEKKYVRTYTLYLPLLPLPVEFGSALVPGPPCPIWRPKRIYIKGHRMICQ